MQSNYFSKRGLIGMARIGDILIPGDEQFPSFSTYGGLEHVDDLVAFAPEEDIATLNMVMAVLSFCPTGLLQWVVKQMSAARPGDTGMMAPLYRQLNIGVRGIIFSLYYGEKRGSEYKGADPMAVIGYELKREM